MVNQPQNEKHPLHDQKERKNIQEHQRPSCNPLLPGTHFFHFMLHPHLLAFFSSHISTFCIISKYSSLFFHHHILPNPLGHPQGYGFSFRHLAQCRNVLRVLGALGVSNHGSSSSSPSYKLQNGYFPAGPFSFLFLENAP